METTSVVFISPNKCPFKFNGQNIAEMRRFEVRKVAIAVAAVTGSALEIDGTKNDMLSQIIAVGNARSWESELSEMFEDAVAKVETKKPEEKKPETKKPAKKKSGFVNKVLGKKEKK